MAATVVVPKEYPTGGWDFWWDFGDSRLWVVGFGGCEVEKRLGVHCDGLQDFSIDRAIELLRWMEWNIDGLESVGVVWVSDYRVAYGGMGVRVWMERGDKSGWVMERSTAMRVLQGQWRSGDVMNMMVGEGTASVRIEMLDEPKPFPDKEGEMSVIDDVLTQARGLTTAGSRKIGVVQNMTEPIQRQIDRWRVWRHRLRGEPQIYVKDTERKRLGALVGLLMVVLVTSVVLGRMRLVANQRQAALEAVYAPAASALVEAEKIVGSNPLAAKDLLMNQRQVLEKAILEYEVGSDEYNKLSSVLAQITTLYGVVSGERRLESMMEYYQLSLAREGMIGSRMGYGDGWLVVLDSLSGVAVGVEVKTKQTRLLAGGEILEGAQLVAVGTGKGVVYGKRGMVGVYWSGRAAEVLAQPEESLGEPGVLGMFGGNVYLSDRLSGDLWRYPGLDGGLGGRGRWFGPGVVPNLSNVQAIAVDGDVWLGSNDGKVTRYRQGAPLNFVIQGLDRPLSQVMAIAALYEDDEMFVLDGVNNRLVVLGKDGVYRRQYLWEDMGEMRDMVVVADEEGGKTAYLLSEETIYRFPADQ